MTENKLALDSYSELKLLTDIWKIEELVEEGNTKKALKKIRKLVEEIRFSEIIDSYTLFDTSDQIREEDLLDTISSTVKNTPNDMELGGQIRQLFRV